MNYIATASIDWADEFDVHFCEILSEEDYQKYKYLQEKLKSFKGSLCFGTNEYFDGDFEFLNFKFQPITDEELAILRKFGCTQGESFWYHMTEQLYDYMIEMCPELCVKEYNHGNAYYGLKEDPFEATLDTFKFYVDTLVKAINEAG